MVWTPEMVIPQRVKKLEEALESALEEIEGLKEQVKNLQENKQDKLPQKFNPEA